METGKKLEATLLLVNYAKQGTKHEDEVRVMEVMGVDAKAKEPVRTRDRRMTRAEFSRRF